MIFQSISLIIILTLLKSGLPCIVFFIFLKLLFKLCQIFDFFIYSI